ncbi:MAG TPA: efflux RND transporter permease subunit [Acidiferrobacterales bacterium]
MERPARTVRLAQWIVDHPWRVLLLSLGLVFAAAAGAPRIVFTNDYRVFFSADNPQLKAFEALERTYTKNDNVLIVLAPKSGDVFTRDTLAAVESLTAAAWQVPYSIRVDSITNFQHTHADTEGLVVRNLVTDAPRLGRVELSRVRAIATTEPLLVNRLVSPTGHVTGVNVTVQLPGQDSIREVPEVAQAVRALAERVRAEHPDIDVHLTGMVMMNAAFSEASQADMRTLVPLSFLVIAVTVGLLLRGWSGTFAALWVILLSIAAAMGLTGWLGIRLSPPSASAPILILTLAVANAVHLLASFFHSLRAGLDKRAAMIESLRVNAQPVFLTSLTTMIGFLSMNFSDAPPFRDLGNIVALGVVAAWLLAMFLLPALMMLLPVRVRPHSPDRSPAMERLAEFVIARRTALLIGMGALIVLLIAFIPRNELNDVYTEYFDHSIPFRVDSDFAAGNLGGLYVVHYSLEAGRPSGVSDPAFLAGVETFAQWYRAQSEVVHVASFTDIMKRLSMNMHSDDPAHYRLPERQTLAAQYLLLYEMSLPYGLDLNDQINIDKSATRLSVTLKTLSVNDFLALEDRAQDWLAANTPGIRANGTGTVAMFAHIGERNIRSMLTGTTLALVLISFVLVFALRSLKIGAVSLIPNLVPAAMGFGLWGILVGEVGLSLSVVTGMTLGIVVDDTVHFLSKYLRARREKRLTPEDAVRYAYASVGTALWVTSVALIAGFLVLALSAFKLNASMGLLTAIVIAFALAADFLFLAPLLLKLEEKSHAQAVDDNTAVEPARP